MWKVVITIWVVVLGVFFGGLWFITPDKQAPVAQPPPTTTEPTLPKSAKNFEPHAAQMLTREFTHVSVQLVSGDNVNVSDPMHLIGGGERQGEQIDGAWFTYMQNLQDARIGWVRPQPVGIHELAMAYDSPGTVCIEGDDYIYPKPLLYPLYCRAKAASQAKPHIAYIVLPAGLSAKLRNYAKQHGEHYGWLLASMVASIEYTYHLHAEMPTTMSWPEIANENEPFRYCMAGIGLRAVFPPELSDADIQAQFPTLDTLVTKPSGNPQVSYDKFIAGFRHGVPAWCPVA